MSVQRRHGQVIRAWPSRVVQDKRGNDVVEVDLLAVPTTATAAVIPQRSSKAEVPGQQQIDVVRLIVTADIPGLSLWSRVEHNGDMWDVASPPAYHHGTRLTRHWSIDIRRRP